MRGVLIALALIVATLWVNGPAKHAPMVYEDFRYLSDPAAWTWHVPSRALTAWSFVAQRDSASLVPLRAVNLGLHVLAGLLVWALAAALGARRAWLAGGVMLLHPLNVQAVAYLSGRADLIVTVGLLLAVLGVALRRRSVAWWALVPVGVFVALTAKETGVMVFPLLLLTWWASGGKLPMTAWPGWWSWTVWASLAWLAVVCALPVVYRMNHTLAMTGVGAVAVGDPLAWAGIQATSAWYHVSRVAWPFGLAVDYDFDVIAVSWRHMALVAWLCVPLLAWLMRSRRRLSFGAWWVWAWVLPRLVVQTPMGYLNDHQWYAAMAGVSVALAGSGR